MTDLPQSTVEAVARARYERSRGISKTITYTWEERNRMLPASGDLEDAAADLQAALDEGGVISRSDYDELMERKLEAIRERDRILEAAKSQREQVIELSGKAVTLRHAARTALKDIKEMRMTLIESQRKGVYAQRAIEAANFSISILTRELDNA